MILVSCDTISCFHSRDQKPIHTTVTICRYAEEECAPEELWTKTTSTMSEIAKKYIPKRKRQNKAWLKNTTMDIADERRTAKSRGDLEGWARLNKEFRKAVSFNFFLYLGLFCYAPRTLFIMPMSSSSSSAANLFFSSSSWNPFFFGQII